MKRILFMIVFVTASFISFSQTARIAHRSHSGKDLTFNIADSKYNFGLPPPDSLKKKPVLKKDSLKVPSKDTNVSRDSMKYPEISAVDNYKRTAIQKEVYTVLSEMMLICSRGRR